MKKIISVLISAMMIMFCIIPAITASAASYESESNNAYEMANILGVNSKITASLSTQSDVDFFRITVPSNGKLNIAFHHTFKDSGKEWAVSVNMRLEDGTYSEIYSKVVQLLNAETINFPAFGAKAGTVFCIKVKTYAYNQGIENVEYSVSNTFTSTENFEKEPNNAYETANTISVGSKVSGDLAASSDKDFFTFTADKSTDITVYFSHKFSDKVLGWTVTLYQKAADGTYTELEKNAVFLKSSEDIKFSTVHANAGTKYCVKVVQYGTNYFTSEEYSISYNSGRTGNFISDNDGGNNKPLINPDSDISGVSGNISEFLNGLRSIFAVIIEFFTNLFSNLGTI